MQTQPLGNTTSKAKISNSHRLPRTEVVVYHSARVLAGIKLIVFT